MPQPTPSSSPLVNLLLGFQIGLKEIWAHKFRSFLTMLGIILGVASLLSMFGLTEGIARGMREMMESTGGVERVQVNSQEIPEDQQARSDLASGRTMADVAVLQRAGPLIDLVAAESSLNNAAVTRGGKTWRAKVTGGLPSYAEMGKYTIDRGRMIAELDLERAHRVVVLGHQALEELWPDDPEVDPVGQSISINGVPFMVVGTFPFFEREEDRRKRELNPEVAQEKPKKARGRGRWDPFSWKNRAIVIPITTMFQEFKSAQVKAGKDEGPNYQLDGLFFRVADTSRFQQARDLAHASLLRSHRGIEDFALETREDWFDNIETSVRAARVSGGLIAGISLLVGGIGIMNIMLASITERIREIGVRRAIGATERDIFVQIVVESTVIGVIGGLIGLAASGLMIKLLVLMAPTENAPIVTPGGILISLGFAVGIGIFSGLYPAWRASRLDPIEALRYG